MPSQPKVFLSYCRADKQLADKLEAALSERGMRVWRDVRSIRGGERWSLAIERGVRQSRGVIVLVTEASCASDWVTYEYAFATGAGVPVLAVVAKGSSVPRPLRGFQGVTYGKAADTAQRVEAGFRAQSRAAGQARAAVPRLVARFQEHNGEVRRASGEKVPALWMDLWIEDAPPKTRSVNVEILDHAFRDRKWTQRRRKTDLQRAFLTDDMNSYGDVDVWVSGNLPGRKGWEMTSTLYEALRRYYRNRTTSPEIRRALAQIRTN